MFGSLRVYELPLYLFPLDSDLLSMELPNAFKEFILDGDPTSIHYAAKVGLSIV